MKHVFKIGDHVEWNSEVGLVRGTIKKVITSEIKFKTYIVHASKEEPQKSFGVRHQKVLVSDTNGTLS
jgi:hypothetical protein